MATVERGRALVHPRAPPLVGADDHREPHVGELVGGETVEPLLAGVGRIVGPHERHHRVLHAAALDAAALHGGHVRPRVGEAGPAGEEVDAVPGVLPLLLP